MESVNSSVHRVMHRSAEHQRQNERLFGQLELMRDRLLGSPTGGAAVGGSTAGGAPVGGRRAGAGGQLEGGPTQEHEQTEAIYGQIGMDVSGVEDPLSRTLIV